MTHNVTHPSDSAAPRERKRRSARSTLPDAITDRWMESPAALWEHGGEIGLDLSDIGFVGLLWSHKWYADSTISPSMETLAEKLNVCVRTVSRRVKRLEEEGWLTVTRTPAGGVEEYDLAPLWLRLANVVAARESHLSVIDGGRADPDNSVEVTATDVSTPARTYLSPEVGPRKVRQGTTPHASAREVSNEEIIAQLRRDVADPSTFASTRAKLLREIDRLTPDGRAVRAARGIKAMESLNRARRDREAIDRLAAQRERESVEATCEEVGE